MEKHRPGHGSGELKVEACRSWEDECAHRHLGPEAGNAALAGLLGSSCPLPSSQDHPLGTMSVLGLGDRVQCQMAHCPCL